MARTSATTTGLMVMVTVTGAELKAAVLVAVRRNVTVEVTATAGAVKLTVAVVGLEGVTVRPIRAGPEVCTAAKVSGVSAGTFGSEPLATKLAPVPETTVKGATPFAVGAVGALMVTEV